MSMALRINIMELIKLPTQIRAHAQQYKKNPILKKSTAKEGVQPSHNGGPSSHQRRQISELRP